MKDTEKFSYTLLIPNVCELQILGIAYCRPDNDFRDRFDWDVDMIAIRALDKEYPASVPSLTSFAMHAYGDEIDEALYPYVVSLFGYNPDEEDLTTDMRQDIPFMEGVLDDLKQITIRPEIFGRDTDLNPEYGC